MDLIMSTFYRLGLWHHGDVPTTRELKLKIFYSIYYALYIASLTAGVCTTVHKDELIFSVESAIRSVVFAVRFLYIIWKQKEIVELANEIAVYFIEEREDFSRADQKLKRFMKFMNLSIISISLSAVYVAFIMPFLGSERTFFFNIGFPLDWKNNEIAFWMAFAFSSSELCLSAVTMFT